MKIQKQAAQLNAALNAILRGTGLAFRIHHTPRMDGFHIYAYNWGNNLMSDGSQLCYIEDLSLNNVPYILNCLCVATGESMYMQVTKHKRAGKPAYYMMDVKHASGSRRISTELANALHEAAVRDDEITVTNSTRLADVAFNDYIDRYQYTVITD